MSRLTEREQSVYDKKDAGLTFKQIAKDLGLCVQTVSFAYRRALQKIEWHKVGLEPTELEVYKRALKLAIIYAECGCDFRMPSEEYFLEEARKELEDERKG